MKNQEYLKWNRRELIKLGLMAGGASMVGSKAWTQQCIDQTPIPINQAFNTCIFDKEFFPTSPFILHPFTDPLPCPPGSGPNGTNAPFTSLRPGYRQPDGKLTPNARDAWTVRVKNGSNQTVISPPSPAAGDQDALGARPRVIQQMAGTGGTNLIYNLPDAGTHQLWPGQLGSILQNYADPRQSGLLYHIRLQVRQHSFTTSAVQPIDSLGAPVAPPPGAPAVKTKGGYILPASTIYGFNGTFPGPMLNLEYGKPVVVRFENDLDRNELCLDRQDFGSPDWAFVTHLHNGHTAPESDGQPNHMTDHDGGYQPGEWVDNLYNNYPAGGDEKEKQASLWFHDHRLHHTGANVYKGMVGLAPHYDPILDTGDEAAAGLLNTSLHLPGRRTNNKDGSFDVKYDIYMGLYDVRMDDGVTQHVDFHNGCGELHPEWWGKSYFRHFPNKGFVGDIFTINGVAYPVFNVFQRKYRFRFLDASVSRIYQLWLMRSERGPVAAPGSLGQWQLPDAQQAMRFTQIANDGGLLPAPIVRNSFEVWPSKRRDFVVDFTKDMNGVPFRKGDVVYLVNNLAMSTGREPDIFPQDPNNPGTGYLVPMMKIVIGGLPPEKDVSTVPASLRPMPTMLGTPATLTNRSFKLQRDSPLNNTLIGSGETQWVINNLQFDPVNSLALPANGVPEVWTTQNGGGGWVHPMHMHMEEHHVLFRDGVPAPDALHPDDTGKEDVTALYPGEEVQFYRNFRTYYGRYVAHCHNLAHEDHNMMFGWAIIDPNNHR
ncbi:MAG TPA: multicopper oxidase domain-containing protein [Terriglobales bacterium]|nr:multicopper oxidase domain-containing protein [Terriglobales bacterium]